MPSKNTDTQKTVNRLIEDFHSDDPSKQEAAMEALLMGCRKPSDVKRTNHTQETMRVRIRIRKLLLLVSKIM